MPNRFSHAIGRGVGFGLFTAFSCVVAWWLASWIAEAMQPPRADALLPPSEYVVAGIVTPAASLNLGEVWEDRDFKLKLPIRNTTGAEIRIVEFQAGCSCVAVSPRSLFLGPWASAELELTIDLAQRAPWEKHLETRLIQLEIKSILDKARLPDKGWMLEGSVRSRITLDTDHLSFGDRAVSGIPSEPRIVKTRIYGQVKSLEASVSPTRGGKAQVTAIGGGV